MYTLSTTMGISIAIAIGYYLFKVKSCESVYTVVLDEGE